MAGGWDWMIFQVLPNPFPRFSESYKSPTTRKKLCTAKISGDDQPGGQNGKNTCQKQNTVQLLVVHRELLGAR